MPTTALFGKGLMLSGACFAVLALVGLWMNQDCETLYNTSYTSGFSIPYTSTPKSVGLFVRTGIPIGLFGIAAGKMAQSPADEDGKPSGVAQCGKVLAVFYLVFCLVMFGVVTWSDMSCGCIDMCGDSSQNPNEWRCGNDRWNEVGRINRESTGQRFIPRTCSNVPELMNLPVVVFGLFSAVGTLGCCCGPLSTKAATDEESG